MVFIASTWIWLDFPGLTESSVLLKVEPEGQEDVSSDSNNTGMIWSIGPWFTLQGIFKHSRSGITMPLLIVLTEHKSCSLADCIKFTSVSTLLGFVVGKQAIKVDKFVSLFLDLRCSSIML